MIHQSVVIVIKGLLIVIALTNNVHALVTDYRSAILSSDRSIGNIQLGNTTLTSLKKKYGGAIQRVKDADGTSNFLCLYFIYAQQKYLLRLVSGSAGGWDTLTEYDLSKISAESPKTECGKYKYPEAPLNWIGKKSEEILDIYGKPSTKIKGALQYSYSYQDKPPDSKDIFDVYSGITFYFDNKGTIQRLNVFEVKTK